LFTVVRKLGGELVLDHPDEVGGRDEHPAMKLRRTERLVERLAELVSEVLLLDLLRRGRGREGVVMRSCPFGRTASGTVPLEIGGFAPRPLVEHLGHEAPCGVSPVGFEESRLR
jgi:hypothetical protein